MQDKKAIEHARNRIATIDKMFADATGWEPWMPGHANERETLAHDLWQSAGIRVNAAHRLYVGDRIVLNELPSLDYLKPWLSDRRFNSWRVQDDTISLSWDKSPGTEWSRSTPRGTIVLQDKRLAENATALVAAHSEA
jgi:hypothetical protein